MEDEIKNEDVKAEFLKLQGQAETTEESSTEETEAAASSAEDVKSETAEEEKVIPYSRFKEVNEKVRNYEELEKEVGNLVERGPDGKFRIRQVEEPKEEEGLKLSEEEQLALDSVQVSVIDKLINRTLALKERQAEADRAYKDQSASWWGKAQEDFPDVKNKEGEFYKRADKIFREQYVTPLGKGRWTAPPNAHYLSCLQAEKELAREKAKTTQAKIEEKKNQRQQVFVEKKSSTVQAKKKVEEKEFEKLSTSEQEDALREQFQETHPEE